MLICVVEVINILCIQFSQREKQRKLQELTVADRIVLNTTMALVSNQTGRKLVFRLRLRPHIDNNFSFVCFSTVSCCFTWELCIFSCFVSYTTRLITRTMDAILQLTTFLLKIPLLLLPELRTASSRRPFANTLSN